MSIRVDSSSLITGAVVVGDPGLGVLAELVPSTGEHGPGIASTWLEPAEAGKEVRVLITQWPEVGSLFVWEDTSFEYNGPGGTAYAQLYVEGQPVDTPQTVTVTVGAATHEVAPVAAVAQPTASAASVQQGGQHAIVVTGAVSQPTAGALSISQTHGTSPTGASAQPTAATVSVYSGVPSALVAPVAADAQPTASTVSVSQAYGVSPQPALATPAAEAITVGQVHNVGIAPATAQPTASVVWLPLLDGFVPRVALGARLSVSVLAARVQATSLSARLQ